MSRDESASPPSILEEIQQSKPFRSRSQEAYVALLRTADDSRRYISNVLEPEGVTLQQYNVLRILRGAGKSGVATLAIAERMLERTPGVTRLIDRMERKGWVERSRCTEDRRRVWCKITESGLSLLEKLDRPVSDVDDAFGDVLDEDELGTLVGYLDRLRVRFNRSG
ncbi:MAG: MarR family transcriptional regulator [Gemmatimonadota bacterium]|nr:MarR family transcriptional regulator [Gemmatimonadota bacterium]MDH3424258.1 MarR family transcriptional regulator [Gemmatimonadota bacterium]